MELKPYEFWDLTFYEFSVIYKGYIKGQNRRINEMRYTAYYTALFERQPKLPDLKNVLIDESGEREEKKPQTVDEMLAIVRLINAAHGGVEKIN